MLALIPVKKEDRELLWNINQKYLYEMTNFYPEEMDEVGNLHYGYFDRYFDDPERKAFFLYHENAMVGFAMIHPYSVLRHTPDHTMAEFTIFPMYRRKHLATEAAKRIFSAFPGSWEIKYNEKNTAAKKLWTQVTSAYQPRVHHLNELETVLEFVC